LRYASSTRYRTKQEFEIGSVPFKKSQAAVARDVVVTQKADGPDRGELPLSGIFFFVLREPAIGNGMVGARGRQHGRRLSFAFCNFFPCRISLANYGF
jgi:hypothetical protein